MMIKNLLKTVRTNICLGSRLNEVPFKNMSTSDDSNPVNAAKNVAEEGNIAAKPTETTNATSAQTKETKTNDNKRTFQTSDKSNQKKNFSPFKSQKKNEDKQTEETGNQGNQQNNKPNHNNTSSPFKGNNHRRDQPNSQFKKEDGGNQQQQQQPQQQQQQHQQNSQQQQQSQNRYPRNNEGEGFAQQQNPRGFGNEGQFLSLLNKSDQGRSERNKGMNQHQTLVKRMKQFEQNGNPTEQDLRSAIETYSALGLFDKVISTFIVLREQHKGLSLNDTVLNAVLDAHMKSPAIKLSAVNLFLNTEFVQPDLLKLLYKDTIQSYICRVCTDSQLSVAHRIESLQQFLSDCKATKSISSFSFQGVDLSVLAGLFTDANTHHYLLASSILTQLLALSLGDAKQIPKNLIEQMRIQLEIINSKKIFENLLALKQYQTCRELVNSLSKAQLLSSQSSSKKAFEQQKFISLKDLIQFGIESKQDIAFWIDIVAKKVEFEAYSAELSQALLKLKMEENSQDTFSKQALYDFFLNIQSYGALSAAQVYTLMEISIFLKEYTLAIELFTNHQKYTNRRRDTFVYEKMMQIVSTVDLRAAPSISTKDPALSAFRKLLTEAEQQTGKQIPFLPSKIFEIKSLILDGNLESAYSIFNDRFLKDSISNYQALKIKYFLLFVLQQQEEKGEITHHESNIAKFVNTVSPKQLIQLWQDERNDTNLAKQLANKDQNYHDFIKRIEVEKYFSIIKRDMNNGLYTIEDRRNNLDNVYINEYEKYVIDNFEELNPVMTLDAKLKGAVLDGILKIRRYEELFKKKEDRKVEKLGEKAEGKSLQELGKHESMMLDTQIEINKIFGRPIDTPVDVPELYKKFDVEDKENNKYIENYVRNLQQAEEYKDKPIKMKFMTVQTYKEQIQLYPELLEKASILARPQIPAEANLVFDLMVWGAENKMPLAIQLGEIFCDLNGIAVPYGLTEQISKTIDPFNDSPDYLNQFSTAKKLIGDINRERIYHSYTHFSQKPQFVQTINKLAQEDRYKDEAAYVLQKDLCVNRFEKYGIPEEFIMAQLSNDAKNSS